MLNAIDLARADLNLLVLFEVVLEERHIGRAAERLHLTPSAVSHGLTRLRRLFNDPLFLRTPKGVTPTARSLELAEPVAEILGRVRNVMATAVPFDPRTSRRRFVIGAPDGALLVFLQPLLVALQEQAPGIDISLRQLLPAPGEVLPEKAWRGAFADLESRSLDIAVLPIEQVATRFHLRPLYQEDFVIAMRAGHPFADNPTLEHYCDVRHLVVSQSGDAHGFVDEALARQGLARRVALTVPNFMFALPMIAESDLVAALPRSFVALQGERFGVMAVEAPVALPRFQLNTVALQVATRDAGVAWLLQMLDGVRQAEPPLVPGKRKKRR